MTASEFIDRWNKKSDSDETSLVGIAVNWEKIKPDSKVNQFFGREAWEKIYNFTPPWFEAEKRKPFRDFVTGGSTEYNEEIKREKGKTQHNKFEFIRTHGLAEPLSPLFVAFADTSGSRGVLGDGCHRFLVADYSIRSEGLDLTKDVQKTELDVICLENFGEVIPFDPFG